MHLDRTTRRILGALIEKRYSTPEQYPLTLNALVLACNQKSNRDPEMQLEEFLVEGSLRQLRIEGWITIVEREYGRAVRYAERMVEKLGLTDKEAALLAELMLRGPQTEQELPRRCERMARIGSSEETLAVLRGMAARGLVVHLPREVGQRLARWKHLLTPPDEAEAAPTATHAQGTYAAVRSPAATPASAPSQVNVPAPSFAIPNPMHAIAAAAATAPQRPAASEATTIVAAVPGPSEPTTQASPSIQPQPAGAADVAALRSVVTSLRAELDRLTERVARLEKR